MQRFIHLVRHGQASAGTANYDRLSSLGRQQSTWLGQWWQRSGFQIDAAWHGTLERQRDTAHLALQAAGLSTQPAVLADLDEYDHRAVDAYVSLRQHAVPGTGTVSANPESMSYADYADIMRRWRDSAVLPESLEHWHAFAARGWQAIADVADASVFDDESRSSENADASLVFFTSGGIISTVLATVLDLDFDHTIDAIWRVRNASVTTLAYEHGQARLVEFNAVPHLQVHHDPALITLI